MSILSVLSVTWSMNTRFSSERMPRLSLIDNMVAVCGQEDGETRLKLYDLTKRETFSVNFDYLPSGMTEILLNNQPTLALADR